MNRYKDILFSQLLFITFCCLMIAAPWLLSTSPIEILESISRTIVLLGALVAGMAFWEGKLETAFKTFALIACIAVLALLLDGRDQTIQVAVALLIIWGLTTYPSKFRDLLIDNPDMSTHFGGGQPNLPVNRSTIDPEIFPLVEVINTHALATTVTSCQGHYRDASGNITTMPYVYFKATEAFAEKLDYLIQTDDARQRLHLYWHIQACFGPDRTLHYTLTAPIGQIQQELHTLLPWQIKNWWTDLRRKQVADINFLAWLVSSLAELNHGLPDSPASPTSELAK